MAGLFSLPRFQIDDHLESENKETCTLKYRKQPILTVFRKIASLSNLSVDFRGEVDHYPPFGIGLAGV